MTKSLLEKLTEYRKTRIPMHMPGHKRNNSQLSCDLPYGIDITEIDGFDNLHDMQGVLKETAELAATLYGAKHSFPLVNGSTCGILAAMHALIPRSGHVLLSRSSHKSVYHGVDLLGLVPHYLTVDTDEHGISGKISPKQVENALSAHNDIRLVILTSPTYEGMVQNTKEIADICHNHGAYLLVDSAHGAHFGFSKSFSESEVTSGADIVVMSLHKTMPCLTQTALLHICSDSVDKTAVQEALSIFETSSPSYILLASVDSCLRYVASQKNAIFPAYTQRLATFYRKTEHLRNLSVFCYDDPGKIIISTEKTNLTGAALASKLRSDFSIETEMSAAHFVLAMTSICDEDASFDALADALIQIDVDTAPATRKAYARAMPLPEQICTPSDARKLSGSFTKIDDCAGKTALESVWAYPPGIPLIVPGEKIPQSFAETLAQLMQADVELKSTKGKIKEHMIFTI